MSLDDLSPRVTAWFRAQASRYGLDPGLVEARYILNWGGFVNASFIVTDGKTFYHLKLTDDEESLTSLEQWQDLNEHLAACYHAPKILDWVEIPDSNFAGPLFQYISGVPADLAVQPDVLENVLDLLRRLHADQTLTAYLKTEDEGFPTCAEYFISVYIDRFDEDLRIVAGDLPPFVSLPLLDWMMGETRELEGQARDLPVFQAPAESPTHGDLWSSNILVKEDGSFSIIDWDDLALGDPALEYAIILGPLWRSGVLTQAQVEDMLPPGEGLRERFRVCLRAYLLDEVIDSLADWVESGFAPQHQNYVQAEKERVHRDALLLYRSLFEG